MLVYNNLRELQSLVGVGLLHNPEVFPGIPQDDLAAFTVPFHDLVKEIAG
jgi:hypothetical protein